MKGKRKFMGPGARTRGSKSQTVPGQSLVPAELLKRHLAGTLPDIAKTPRYTYNEHGQQISEDLSQLELHELHDLTQNLISEYRDREKELADQADKDYQAKIIADHKAKLKATKDKQVQPKIETTSQEGKPDQKSPPKGA